MSVDLSCLIELEQLDREVAKLENSKMEYPVKVTEMEAVLLEKKGILTVAEGKLDTVKTDIRKCETALEDNKEALATSHDRLNLVKTNREYDAILLEITERKAMIEKDRKKLLKLTDKKKAAETEISDAMESLDESAEDLQPQIDDLSSKIESIDDDVSKVVADRAGAESTVPEKYLSEYNRIRSNRKNARVLSVINDRSNACGYCYQILSARVRKEAQVSSVPVICENCGSIIVWDSAPPVDEN